MPFKILESHKRLILSHRYSPIIGIENKEIPNYPLGIAYLKTHQDELKGRSRATGDDWSYWRRGDERNSVDFSLPKLVWPYRGKRIYAAIDFNGKYHSQDVILLTLNILPLQETLSPLELDTLMRDWQEFGIYFYLAIFNSLVFERYLFHHAKEFAQHVKDFQPNNFDELLLPFFDKNDSLQQLIVQTCQEVY